MFVKYITEARKIISAGELKRGSADEMEHTKSKSRAKEIAMDHLRKNPKYYSELEKCGLEDLD